MLPASMRRMPQEEQVSVSRMRTLLGGVGVATAFPHLTLTEPGGPESVAEGPPSGGGERSEPLEDGGGGTPSGAPPAPGGPEPVGGTPSGAPPEDEEALLGSPPFGRMGVAGTVSYLWVAHPPGVRRRSGLRRRRWRQLVEPQPPKPPKHLKQRMALPAHPRPRGSYLRVTCGAGASERLRYAGFDEPMRVHGGTERDAAGEQFAERPAEASSDLLRGSWRGRSLPVHPSRPGHPATMGS